MAMNEGRMLDRLRGDLPLLAILILALALRTVGLGNGLPFVVGADESFEVHRALALGVGEIDPLRFSKGGFFYLLFVGYGLYFFWLLWTGQIFSTDDFARAFVTDPTPFWVIGRLAHVLLAVGVVYATFRLARRAFGRRVGLLSAAIIAVSPLNVRHAHWIGVDLPMLLCLLIVLDLALEFSDGASRPRPILLGLMFGLAVMMKLPGVLVAAPVAVACVLRIRSSSAHSWKEPIRTLAKAGAISLVVWLAGNPGVVGELRLVLDQVGLVGRGSDIYSREVYGLGGRGTNLWIYYGRVLLRELHVPLLACMLLGVATAVWFRERADWLLVVFSLVYYTFFSLSQNPHLFYPRYMLPLVPVLAVLAARAVVFLADKVPAPMRIRSGVAVSAAIIVLVFPAIESSRWVMRMTHKDTRQVAAEWMESHAEAGSAVFLIGNPEVRFAPPNTIPLRNQRSNLELLANEQDRRGQARSRFLRMREQSERGVPFDLRAIGHTEMNKSLEEYLAEGVEYFVLDQRRFAGESVQSDKKRPQALLSARSTLRQELNSSLEVKKMVVIDPDWHRAPGPPIEIYQRRNEAWESPEREQK